MSATLDLAGIPTVRTGVTSTYVVSLQALTSVEPFYKIGRTRNLPNRLGSLLSVFNSGHPKGFQGFPRDLCWLCPFDSAKSSCRYGDECYDRQYEMRLVANIEGDYESQLHRHFSELRVPSNDLTNGVRSSEWFFFDEDFCCALDDFVASTVRTAGVAS